MQNFCAIFWIRNINPSHITVPVHSDQKLLFSQEWVGIFSWNLHPINKSSLWTYWHSLRWYLKPLNKLLLPFLQFIICNLLTKFHSRKVNFFYFFLLLEIKTCTGDTSRQVKLTYHEISMVSWFSFETVNSLWITHQLQDQNEIKFRTLHCI